MELPAQLTQTSVSAPTDFSARIVTPCVRVDQPHPAVTTERVLHLASASVISHGLEILSAPRANQAGPERNEPSPMQQANLRKVCGPRRPALGVMELFQLLEAIASCTQV